MAQQTFDKQTPSKTKLPEKAELTEPKPQPKIMTQELKIILDGMEEIEGILYGMRERIWQLYGPREYNVQAPPTGKSKSIDELKNTLPEIASLLSFEQKGEYTIIKPKQFLGSDNFAKLAAEVRSLNGEYVSAGKDSHFRVPVKKA